MSIRFQWNLDSVHKSNILVLLVTLQVVSDVTRWRHFKNHFITEKTELFSDFQFVQDLAAKGYWYFPLKVRLTKNLVIDAIALCFYYTIPEISTFVFNHMILVHTYSYSYINAIQLLIICSESTDQNSWEKMRPWHILGFGIPISKSHPEVPAWNYRK